MSLRYLSVCSGIEAATVAWHPLGWAPVGFAEIDAFPSKVLAHHYGSNMPGEAPSRNGVPNFGDFTQIPLDGLGAVDLLVGGTPCQAFSVAGKRLSLADARGNLSLAYAVLAHELARSHGLRWAVWENVPGVLSTDDNAFGCFLGALVGADHAVLPCERPRSGRSNDLWRWKSRKNEDGSDGEWIHAASWPRSGMVAGPRARAAWRVLDAQYFGLAQRRERVFVVIGFGDEADPAAVLFEPQGLRRHPPSRGKAGEDVAHQSTFGISSDCFDRSGEGVGGSAAERSGLGVQLELAQTLRAKRPGAVAYGGNDSRGPIEISTALNAHGGPNGRQDFESETFLLAPVAFDCKAGGDTGFSIGDLPGALRGAGYGGGHAAVAFDLRGREGGSQFEGPHDTANLRAASGGSSRSYVATSFAVRRLTPTECHRLQGFPDDHCAIPGAADGPQYKALGNSMAVAVMRWIGERIAEVDAR